MTNVKQNGFFCKLRQLSRDVTSTTTALQSRVNVPPKEDFSSAAVVKLQQVKKEVKEGKKEASELLNNFQRKNIDFDTLLKTCHQFLEFQQNATVEIEEFLHQYGYTTWAEKEAAEAARAKAKNETNQPINEETNEVSSDCQTPQNKPARRSYSTPKLEDYGLSDLTMQAMYHGFRKEVKPVINNTPATVKPNIRNYKFGTPVQSVPDMFVHNGIIVTPGIMNGRPLPSDTPAFHIGGIKGFEKGDNKHVKDNNTKDDVPRIRKTALKLEDYLNSSDSQSGPETFDLQPKRSFVSSRFTDNSDKHTPPEPELLSARLQMIQKASENGNLELYTPNQNAKTLATMSCNTPMIMNKGDKWTPPEPELLSDRLIKQKAASDKSRYTDLLMKEQSAGRDTVTHSTGLPKPVDERAYCFPDVPAPPRLMGRYQFSNDFENIPPS